MAMNRDQSSTTSSVPSYPPADQTGLTIIGTISSYEIYRPGGSRYLRGQAMKKLEFGGFRKPLGSDDSEDFKVELKYYNDLWTKNDTAALRKTFGNISKRVELLETICAGIGNFASRDLVPIPDAVYNGKKRRADQALRVPNTSTQQLIFLFKLLPILGLENKTVIFQDPNLTSFEKNFLRKQFRYAAFMIVDRYDEKDVKLSGSDAQQEMTDRHFFFASGLMPDETGDCLRLALPGLYMGHEEPNIDEYVKKPVHHEQEPENDEQEPENDEQESENDEQEPAHDEHSAVVSVSGPMRENFLTRSKDVDLPQISNHEWINQKTMIRFLKKQDPIRPENFRSPR